jgi:dsRNA-specific ribonuclease
MRPFSLMKSKVCNCLSISPASRIYFHPLVDGTTWGKGSGSTKTVAMDAAAKQAVDYGDRTGAFERL